MLAITKKHVNGCCAVLAAITLLVFVALTLVSDAPIALSQISRRPPGFIQRFRTSAFARIGSFRRRLADVEEQLTAQDYIDAEFNDVDLDHNGVLSTAEFTDAAAVGLIPMETQLYVFRMIDRDNSRGISRLEFDVAVSNPSFMEALARLIVAHYDWDGDSLLNVNELKAFLCVAVKEDPDLDEMSAEDLEALAMLAATMRLPAIDADGDNKLSGAELSFLFHES